MNNEQNTTRKAALPLQRVPGFEPLRYVQEAVDKAGNTVLTMELKHKKKWFRMACPSGGMVLNPLRVTDQMAIFEARVFADKDDRNPMASFTAVRAADKAKDRQYIQAAQEDALSAALDNAGFGLPLINGVSAVGNSAPPTKVADAEQNANGTGQPGAADTPKQTAAPDQPVRESAPRPAPVAPHPHSSASQPATAAAADVRPAPVALQPHGAVVDIAAHQPAAAVPAADGQKNVPGAAAKTEPTPQPDVASQPDPGAADEAAQAASPVEAAESAPAAFTTDMDVAQICPLMTMEYARSLQAPSGIRKGWTLGQVADDAPASLKWYRHVCPDADNITKAACQLLLEDLGQREALKKAG